MPCLVQDRLLLVCLPLRCRGQVLTDLVLPQNAVILCFSTVPPSFLDTLRPRLDALGKNIGVSLPKQI